MKKKTILLALSLLAVSMSAPAQEVAYGKLQPLHVDGNQLKDPYGNTVVLHGVMDTPNTYFNGGRWQGSKAQGWWDDYNDTGATNCRNYFEKLFTAITDSTNGAYCNIFRLHLDPAWTNGNEGAWKVDAREIQYKSNGEIDYGEAHFSKYTGSRLTKFMRTLYFRLASQAMKHGMYVIMRPPGVCPSNIYVDGSYQKYLLDVWDRVTQNDSILKYSGQIGIELANEPIGVHMADGTDSDKALHDFFQPIVDKIRENGFKGIIWVPGTGYQSNYRAYAKYPITGDNIGYAVHNYAGWYNNREDHCNPTEAIEEFGNSVPIIRTNPIVITEVDWSPQNTSFIDHYNEFNQPVYKNYGTWATASTSKWGKAYKAILDYYGNVSMTLTGTGDYIDIDDYIKNKKVTPAFKTAMEKNGVDPYEACGVACFEWYADYAKVNYPSTERYQPKQEVPENPFDLSADWFNTTILYQNTSSHLAAMTTLKLTKGGCAGWRFDEEEGIDLSTYNYLIIRLVRNAARNTFFRVSDTGNYWAEPYLYDLSVSKEIKIDLHNMQTASGTPVDPSHIRIAGFNSPDADQTLYIKEAFLSVHGETPATAINAIALEGSDSETQELKNSKTQKLRNSETYDLTGRQVTHPTRGLYIHNGKKIFIK